jgi:hypothetical protein
MMIKHKDTIGARIIISGHTLEMQFSSSSATITIAAAPTTASATATAMTTTTTTTGNIVSILYGLMDEMSQISSSFFLFSQSSF